MMSTKSNIQKQQKTTEKKYVVIFSSHKGARTFFYIPSEQKLFVSGSSLEDFYKFHKTPLLIKLPNEKEIIKNIALGDMHTIILTLNNVIYSIGDNKDGRLGIGKFSEKEIFMGKNNRSI